MSFFEQLGYWSVSIVFKVLFPENRMGPGDEGKVTPTVLCLDIRRPPKIPLWFVLLALKSHMVRDFIVFSENIMTVY